MYIPEADVEYLIRTLSEARSRATELAASIATRMGKEHRLAELAREASSKIENMLRELRLSATEAPPQPSAPRVQDPIPLPVRPQLETGHWLPMFIEDLTSELRARGNITFEDAERLLHRRKDDFRREFLIARRMYRAYPCLFPEISGEIEPRKRRAVAR